MLLSCPALIIKNMVTLHVYNVQHLAKNPSSSFVPSSLLFAITNHLFIIHESQYSLWLRDYCYRTYLLSACMVNVGDLSYCLNAFFVSSVSRTCRSSLGHCDTSYYFPHKERLGQIGTFRNVSDIFTVQERTEDFHMPAAQCIVDRWKVNSCARWVTLESVRRLMRWDNTHCNGRSITCIYRWLVATCRCSVR